MFVDYLEGRLAGKLFVLAVPKFFLWDLKFWENRTQCYVEVLENLATYRY